MQISPSIKKALVTLRKEFNLSLDNIQALLGDKISLDMLKHFEQNLNNQNDFLAIFYLNIFFLILSQRFQIERMYLDDLKYYIDDKYYFSEPKNYNPFISKDFNPFENKRNGGKNYDK